MRSKLQRHAVISPSRWATNYRVIPTAANPKQPWSFVNFPWLKDIHDSKSEYNVVKKSAQVGVSETMLNITFFTLDIMKKNVMYILPNQRPDATDFTTRAFDPAIEASDYMRRLFTGTNNTGHKQVGMCNLYVRGSNSRAALKSVPVSGLIFDEFEEHDHELTKLAEQRNTGQEYRYDWKVSTPFVGGGPIDKLFDLSTREEFLVKCPGCNQKNPLTFEECVSIPTDDPQDSRLLETILHCPNPACLRPWSHEEKPSIMGTGEWVARNPGRLTRGFHINQLYSTQLPIHKVAKLYLESQVSDLAEQEFFNSALGMAHTPAGAKVTDEMLEPLIKNFEMVSACAPEYTVTMGVDVGRVLHVEITLWDTSASTVLDVNDGARARVIWVGEVKDFDQLDKFMNEYNVNFCIVDVAPETRIASLFAMRHYGRVRLCRYNSHATSKSLFADNEIGVSVNRTAWLDQSLGRFRNGTIYLPRNLPRDYLKHIKVPNRVPKKDTNGNPVYRYETPDGVADHYAHARNYNEIALAFVGGNKIYRNMEEAV